MCLFLWLSYVVCSRVLLLLLLVYCICQCPRTACEDDPLKMCLMVVHLQELSTLRRSSHLVIWLSHSSFEYIYPALFISILKFINLYMGFLSKLHQQVYKYPILITLTLSSLSPFVFVAWVKGSNATPFKTHWHIVRLTMYRYLQ